jgi:hypothetical protein
VHGWLDKLVDSVVHWPRYRKIGSQRLVAFCAAAILQPPRHPMSTPLLKLVASTDVLYGLNWQLFALQSHNALTPLNHAPSSTPPMCASVNNMVLIEMHP